MPSHNTIILPSNVKHPFKGVNYISKFLTKLSQPLDTANAYVALKDISFINSINNIPNDKWSRFYLGINLNISSTEQSQLSFQVLDNKVNLLLHETTISLQECSISVGHYTSRSLVTNLRDSMSADQRARVHISFHKSIERVSIRLERDTYLVFPKSITRLGELLGFDQELMTGPGYYLAPYEAISISNNQNLCICSDIISPQHVGESLFPVLQTVTLRGRRDEVLTYRFPYPKFHKVSRDSVQLIEMKLLNSSGQVAQFEKGTVICTLLFVSP